MASIGFYCGPWYLRVWWWLRRRFGKRCPGPLYLADQGIEVCSACGGCTCCEHPHVDHSKAPHECQRGLDGDCLYDGMRGHVCEVPSV